MSALVSWWRKLAAGIKVRVLKIDHLINKSIISLAVPIAQSCISLSVECRDLGVESSEVFFPFYL